MTTERRGLFVLKTSEDGTKCAAECPHMRDAGMIVCTQFRDDDEPLELGHYKDVEFRRRGECIAAESAAREAAKEAFLDGYRDGEADERMRASRRGES